MLDIYFLRLSDWEQPLNCSPYLTYLSLPLFPSIGLSMIQST